MGRHLQALMPNAATVEVRSSIKRFTFLPDSNGWVTITVTVSLKTEDPGKQRTYSPPIFRKWLKKLHFWPFEHQIVCVFLKLFLSIITPTIFSESPLLTIQIAYRCFP